MSTFVYVFSIFQLPETFVHKEQFSWAAWSSVTLYFKVINRVYKVVEVVVVEEVVVVVVVVGWVVVVVVVVGYVVVVVVVVVVG